MGSANLSTYDTFFGQTSLSDRIQQASFPQVKRISATNVEGKSPWLQKGSLSPYIEHGEREEIWERRTDLTGEEIAFFKTPQGIVDLNREGIELALDRRVALFFQQSILCYKMPFVFSEQGADDQIGVAKAIHLSTSEKKGGIVHKREAAHSSTIPTLLARVKGDETARTFVYLKGGSNHAQHNATIGMHVDVNGADELLDGKKDKGLRGTAIKILNRVAEGLDPVQATKEFLAQFKNQASQISQKLELEDPRKAVLNAYVEGIQNIAQQAEQTSEFFDRLIGLQIDPEDPHGAILRSTIYEKRYQLILFEEAIESQIGKRIDEMKKEMGRDGSLLEFLLLKEFGQSPLRNVIEKLFAKTAVIFDEEYKEPLTSKQSTAHKAFETRLKNLQTKYAKPLQDLQREIRTKLRELSSSEFAYRAGVFKDLRARVRNWTQKEFCEQYHETTGKKVSQTWVSRMEQPSRIDTKLSYQTPLNQRTRPITLEDAHHCAQTFKIDVGLFLPCLVTSDS